MNPTFESIPIIDLKRLEHESPEALGHDLEKICHEIGFFYVVGHQVSEGLQKKLDSLARQFFALPLEQKMAIRMERAPRAWRGFFPVGQELTSGVADLKEGIYFGNELSSDHPLVARGTPMHGANLFPDIPGFKDTVLSYMEAVAQLGHQVMELLSLSLDLDREYFAKNYTKDPLLLFRIFHYPPDPNPNPVQWGVGEHTDYGLLTLLRQDTVGGLEVKSKGRWLKAPPVKNSFVCNIGDMLEKMTGGYYLSTPHRVRNISGQNRYSFPLFFDPHFESVIRPIRPPLRSDPSGRWDHTDVHLFQGTYGQYLLSKVGKVFPNLLTNTIGTMSNP